MERMANIMDSFRNNIPNSINGSKVTIFRDYSNCKEIELITHKESVIHLPSSNVISFILENESYIVIRPSGTEPKIKVYIESISDTMESSKEIAKGLISDISKKMGF